MKEKKTTLTIEGPVDQLLTKYCQKNGLKRNFVINRAIQAYVTQRSPSPGEDSPPLTGVPYVEMLR